MIGTSVRICKFELAAARDDQLKSRLWNRRGEGTKTEQKNTTSLLAPHFTF